jgi:serine/threonine protein kinase
MTQQSLVPDISGYRDVTLVSTGSSSLVFRAVQSRLTRTVAIKVLLVDGDAATHAQYQRELETTVLLSSQPHIVSIIDTGSTSAGNPYIVMEYCPGGSYAQILRQRGPLPVDEIVDVGSKVADALQAAHDVGVLHRDVKPSNILRSAFGPALADFGIARAPHQLSGTASLDRMTPHHASPEAMRKDVQTPASDLYSLASTLWHLLAGRPPFADPTRPGQSLEDLRDRVMTEPASPVPRPDIPDWLQRELLRALAKDPRQRHPSAHTFAEILNYHAYRSDAADRDGAAAPVFPPPAQPMSGPPMSGPPMSGPPMSAPISPMPPMSAVPPMSAPPLSGSPVSPVPAGGWPVAPVSVSREAFRWPQAAPTRRDDFVAEPAAPALDPAALEEAASSTILWDDPPADRSPQGQSSHEQSPHPQSLPAQSLPAQPPHAAPAVGPDESGANLPAPWPAAQLADGPSGGPADRASALTSPTEMRPAMTPPAQVQPPVSAPPLSAPPFSTPPFSTTSTPGLPVSSPPVSSPPMPPPPMRPAPMRPPAMSGPPVSAPPISGPPISGPPISGPPSSWYPTSGPPAPAQRPGPPPHDLPYHAQAPSRYDLPPHPGIAGQHGAPPRAPIAPAPVMPGPPRSAPSVPPAAWAGGQSRSPRRWKLTAIAAVSLLVLIVAVGVVIGLSRGSTGRTDVAGSPTPSGTQTADVTSQGAPTNVKLTDKGATVTLTWTDPSGGTVQTAVLGGPKGTQPHLLLTLQPGTTTYTQSGVNTAVDYCYIVAAFYSASGANVVADSPQVCTHRLG